MQPLGPAPVEAEPSEEDDAENRVAGLGEADARQVVVDEALGPEPGEEALGPTRCSRCRWTVSSPSTPASSKTTGRMGASRRQSASFWSRPARRPQGVEGRRPGRVGAGAPVEGREGPPRLPPVAAVAAAVSRQRLGAEQLEGAVVAAHLRRRLQLAVDAAVALLDAAGVPRQVEVEEVGGGNLYSKAWAHAVRVDAGDNIWLVDNGSSMAVKLSPAGRRCGRTRSASRRAPIRFMFTQDMFPGRIYKMSLDGTVLGYFGRDGQAVGEFGWIHGLACPSAERGLGRRAVDLARPEDHAARLTRLGRVTSRSIGHRPGAQPIRERRAPATRWPCAAAPTRGLGTALDELFEPFGGVELEMPPREPMGEPPRFD